MQKSSRQKRRERRQVRLKRRIKTNSGVISMSEVEASSMAEPVSTKKKKKLWINWTCENRDNRPRFSNPWEWTTVRTVHWVFRICRFLRLKELFWWTVSGYSGRTVQSGLGFKTLIKTTHSYLEISLVFFFFF